MLHNGVKKIKLADKEGAVVVWGHPLYIQEAQKQLPDSTKNAAQIHYKK